MTEQNRQFSVYIDIDEWRNILQWMHTSLGRAEARADGHFLLEIDGPLRTWVTTDGEQMTVLQLEGPAPRCNFECGEPLEVLVNSRFFRSKSPEDVTLTVTEIEGRRTQSLKGDGFEMVLPEHPGVFPKWKEPLASLEGTKVEIESHLLLEACEAALVIPWGVENGSGVVAWISVQDGRLVIDTPWIEYPHSTVFLDLNAGVENTGRILVSPARLKNLLLAVDSARIILTLPNDPLGLIGVAYDNYQALLLPVDRWGEERAQLEKLLCEFLEIESIDPDGDGDYEITTPEGNPLWVRLHTNVQPISAQVFSVLATDVPCTMELLTELNSINANAAYVKAIWVEGAIMAEADIVAESLDMSELANAVTVVQEMADRYRAVLSVFFGSSGSDPE